MNLLRFFSWLREVFTQDEDLNVAERLETIRERKTLNFISKTGHQQQLPPQHQRQL